MHFYSIPPGFVFIFPYSEHDPMSVPLVPVSVLTNPRTASFVLQFVFARCVSAFSGHYPAFAKDFHDQDLQVKSLWRAVYNY